MAENTSYPTADHIEAGVKSVADDVLKEVETIPEVKADLIALDDGKAVIEAVDPTLDNEVKTEFHKLETEVEDELKKL